MDIRITPKRLSGTVSAVASKSYAHRKIIAALLSDVPTKIGLCGFSADINATLSAIRALGGDYEKVHDGVLITPYKRKTLAEVDCAESGSTARFLLPVSAVISDKAVFTGRGRLPKRPFSELVYQMRKNGADVSSETLPITVSGGLLSGTYTISGDTSSQFISGLLFALPLLDKPSEVLLKTPLESSSYVDLTIDTLAEFGVNIIKNGSGYTINPQKYTSKGKCSVEGDWSNGAFWIVANEISGKIDITGLDPASSQGDKGIMEILDKTEIDASQIPDLVPVMCVLACAKTEKTVIRNAYRLRLKESDRLAAMVEVITALGGVAYADEDSITINGTGRLSGGVVDGHNDHRIVMAAAVASCICDKDVTICGAEAVEKSYPTFFEDFRKLGGVFDVL